MTITPRTCLWPLTGALCISFALSMGLTYRSNGSCYAGVCSETHSPLQTRLQVAVWYLWLALSVTVLGFRSFKPWLRKFLNMRISVFGTTHKAWLSSILMALWISSLFGIITGIWWRELHRFYLSQGPDMVQSAGVLAAISLSGQWAALAFGLALTPVSRHSALGSFFKLSFSGTQKFHMMVSYLLITLVFVHTLLYLYWVGYWKTWPADKQALFPVYNPEHSNDEVYPGNKTALGKYRASLVFTGGASAFILLLIVITSNRFVRGRWFKIFYWVHTLSILSIIVAALHSSTLFYCIAPGIFMWLLDKLMRVYELYAALYGQITPLGKGWYLLSCPLPRTRLEGCACSSPVARFYIYHTDSATRELHPFTTITHLALQDAVTDPTENSINIEFLFRRHGGATPFVSVPAGKLGTIGKAMRAWDKWRQRNNHDRDIQSRMGSLADQAEWRVRQQDSFALFDLDPDVAGDLPSRVSSPDVEALQPKKKKNKAEMLMDNASVPISLRLEGPFFTPANPSHYHTVVCLVDGAGVSGALAIASAFRQLEEYERNLLASHGSTYDMTALSSNISKTAANAPLVERKWKRCLIVWVVREEDYIELPGLKVGGESALEVMTHLTGSGRKAISYYDVLDGVLVRDGEGNGRKMGVDEKASVWVYVSGSEGFVVKAEKACKSRQGMGVEWTCAEIAV